MAAKQANNPPHPSHSDKGDNPEFTGIVPATQTSSNSTQGTGTGQEVSEPFNIPQLTSPMELGYGELHHTVQQAMVVRAQESAHPRIIRLHVEALNDDIEMMTSFETLDDQLRMQAAQLVIRARRLKRELEGQAIQYEIENCEAVEQQIVQVVPADRAKASSIKLAPIKAPKFSGDPSQFRIFRDFFEENILNNDDITDTAKWLRLAESVTDQAAEVISEIPRAPHTLSIAWKLLKDVYGGDDRPVVELYDRLQKLPKADAATGALRIAYSKLEGILLQLENLGHDIADNGYLRWTYLSKFPADIVYHIQKRKNMPLAELREALSELLIARECADYQTGVTPAYQKAPPTPQKSRISAYEQHQVDRRQPSAFVKVCVFCGADHWNDSCTAYTNVESRKKRLAGKCHRCLRRAHEGSSCVQPKRCYHCHADDHHRALCPMKFPAQTRAAPVVQAATLQKQTVIEQEGLFLAFVAQASSANQREPVEVRVVLDTAGGLTLASREMTQELRIDHGAEPLPPATGLGQTELITSYVMHGDVTLHALDGQKITVRPQMVDTIIPEVPTADVEEFKKQFPQYADAYIPATGRGRRIDLLIGSDMLVDILEPKPIQKVNKDLMLIPTKFGSIIMGRRKQHQSVAGQNLLMHLQKNPVQQLTELDLVGLAGLHSTNIEEEQKAIKIFYETIRFIAGRYHISWPWKNYPPMLDANYGLALGRLKSLYRRLCKLPDLLREYNQIIQKQLEDGIIEPVEERYAPNNVEHYLPHHPVLQPGKSTAVRPVYNGAAKAGPAKKSLNDNILKGKNWLTDLVKTLHRFRRHQRVVTADVAKAFHQIAINEQDRDVVRFLWLKNINQAPNEDNIQIYRFKRVAFGIVASPFILAATVRYHADQQQPHEYKEIILQDMYADNLVAALEDHIDPKKFYEYAKNFFDTMSMNLTKWTSNDEELMQHIPQEDQLNEPVQSVLGLKWDRKEDTLRIKHPKKQGPKTPSRRLVASEMAAFFDPLGWATPIVLLARVFFRTIWQKTEKWDTPLTQEQQNEWSEIKQKLNEITNIVIPRKLPLSANQQQVQIHTFVDASATAYAIVSYIRVQQSEKTATAMIATRNRLTPIKTTSIPKLELIAILLGTKYTSFLKEALTLPENAQTFVWSDSKCALTWMQQQKILPTIIEKYITEAKEYGINQYRYVPSQKNYADVATRGADYQTLQQMKWWDGPQWLHDEQNWPENELYTCEENKTSLVFHHQLMNKKQVISEKQAELICGQRIWEYSSLKRLLIRTAYILKALVRLFRVNWLQLQADIDTATALKIWIRWDQTREYAVEGELEAGEPYPLRNMSVFRDEDRVIRCNTRIVNSFHELDTVAPILLVKNSTLTKLIVMQEHQQHMHAGTNHTLAQIRAKYWLPHGRRQVYKIITEQCYTCKKHTAQTYPNPPPAPLPEFRVVRSQKPFHVVGIDVFGPFTIKNTIPGNRQERQKRWVLIFTCATIRAVHLEILSDMTTIEIGYAFRRFIARRGVPAKIISDNAPQFHALDNYFTDLWKTLARAPSVIDYFAQKQIVWDFTPEMAPWMGAIYERLIKSIKNAFERTYGGKALTSRQLETAIIEIEAMLNARPLAYVEHDPEMKVLSPSDFLAAKYTAIPIRTNECESDDMLKRIWKSSQTYLDEFWKKWSQQYILVLRERNDQLKNKRSSAKYQPKKGDVVVMQDPDKRRSAWQIAVVERLSKSSDGIVRAVQVRIPNGARLIRPVITLAPIGIQADLPGIADDQLNRKRDAIVVWSTSQEQDIQQETVITEIPSDEVSTGEAENQQNVPNTGRVLAEHSYALTRR